MPSPVAFRPEQTDAWLARHKELMVWVKAAERRPIGLPYDGMSFNDHTAAEAAYRLLALKEVGYHVPQFAIDSLLAEAAEG